MKILRDTWLVFGRYWGLFIHNPVWVAIGVVQPLLYLVLFAPLLSSIAKTPGFPSGGAYNVFVPGLLVQLGMFGAAGVGFSLIAELRMGVIERLRVTPVSRVSLLLGRALRDILSIVIQSLILIVLALPFGLSINPIGVVVVLALIALIGLLTASIAYAAALWLRSEDSYAPLIFTSSLPILLLSGVLLPLGLAPQWLRSIAAVNPLSYAVDAARAVFLGNLDDPSVVKGVALMAVLAILAIFLGARAFARRRPTPSAPWASAGRWLRSYSNAARSARSASHISLKRFSISSSEHAAAVSGSSISAYIAFRRSRSSRAWTTSSCTAMCERLRAASCSGRLPNFTGRMPSGPTVHSTSTQPSGRFSMLPALTTFPWMLVGRPCSMASMICEAYS
jgi:ABC-2 type transport system permease protein